MKAKLLVILALPIIGLIAWNAYGAEFVKAVQTAAEVIFGALLLYVVLIWPKTHRNR